MYILTHHLGQRKNENKGYCNFLLLGVVAVTRWKSRGHYIEILRDIQGCIGARWGRGKGVPRFPAPFQDVVGAMGSATYRQVSSSIPLSSLPLTLLITPQTSLLPSCPYSYVCFCSYPYRKWHSFSRFKNSLILIL